MEVVAYSTSPKRILPALFIGGFIPFAILYTCQPLLPMFSKEYDVTPAVASLSISVSTVTLAVCMVGASILAEMFGRKFLMVASLLSSSFLTIITAAAPNFTTLLVLRFIQGIALSGVPAIAMTYVKEEFPSEHIGRVMGMYISGTSLGGMVGRIASGVITDYFSWRIALCVIGGISVLAASWFWRTLPNSQHFVPNSTAYQQFGRQLWSNLKAGSLVRLYIIGMVLMGSFVTVYNYIGYRLAIPPYTLSQTAIGAIFLVYLLGSVSSSVMGGLADRFGRRTVLMTGLLIMAAGVGLTLAVNLCVIIVGIAICTIGFFGSHSVASGWVSRQKVVGSSLAPSLYLLFYYTGSSVFGTVGGVFWHAFAWVGVVGFCLCLLLIGIALVERQPAKM